jgi:predicted phosphodiesterase
LIALISDIHSNIHALEAALADIEAQGVKRILCLGDIVGYGGAPLETIAKIRDTCEISMLGNHDDALLNSNMALYFNEWARQAIDWTREQIESSDRLEELYDYMYSLKREMSEFVDAEGTAFNMVHASPRQPQTEYLLPTLAAGCEALDANFAAMTNQVCFYGHTHHPGYFTPGESFVAVKDNGSIELEDGQKYLINVGSVGQPRDRNPELCYAILSGKRLSWHRVSYEIGAAQKLILDAKLPEKLSLRLQIGR